jgi:hypothetical protein
MQIFLRSWLRQSKEKEVDKKTWVAHVQKEISQGELGESSLGILCHSLQQIDLFFMNTNIGLT